MSTQFEPMDVLSKNKAMYDSLADRFKTLYCSSIQDDAVQNQIKAVEAALTRLDVDWANQKEP